MCMENDSYTCIIVLTTGTLNGRYISTQELGQSYENRIHDLEKQIDRATDRETTLIDEKSKFLDLLSAEKEEKRLMLPPPKTSFFDIFRRR